MKVTVNIAGGLAPAVMGRQFVVDSTTLAPADQQTLTRAVDAAIAAPAPKLNSRARDARTYSITIDSGSGSKTIVAEDGGVPEPVRKLVDTVKSLAR